MIFTHVDSETAEWLSVLDAYLAASLVDISNSAPALEIGVWKGAWVIDLMLNNREIRCYGVDPYPGFEDVRKILFHNLFRYKVEDRFSLFPSVDDLQNETERTSFSMIHIDGEHSEDAVKKDLFFAANMIADNGLIIIDDIYHQEFPGIASASFSFLHNSDFASFLITGNKMYVCKKVMHQYFRNKAILLCQDSEIEFSIGFKSHIGGNYTQENSICGYPQIIVRPSLQSLTKFYARIGLEQAEDGHKAIKISFITKNRFFQFCKDLFYPLKG
jgi:hypothetical protein